jgi:hypothetical protein
MYLVFLRVKRLIQYFTSWAVVVGVTDDLEKQSGISCDKVDIYERRREHTCSSSITLLSPG